MPDGRVMYRFRRPWPDGSTHLVLEPVEFLGKLAALVPPPRSHLVRYHGILAPHAKRRRKVTPAPNPAGAAPKLMPVPPRPPAQKGPPAGPEQDATPPKPKTWRDRMRRVDLLKRTMGIDALECPRCRGRMTVIAEIAEPDDIGKILRAMGLPDVPPRASPARPPPQLAFDFTQVGN